MAYQLVVGRAVVVIVAGVAEMLQLGAGAVD